MSAYASLLRGINVGGQKPLRMDSLRQLYASLGLKNVRSYLQSGNIVFESDEPNKLALARLIEDGIRTTCGYPVPVFIRQAGELYRILEGNPFLAGRDAEHNKLHVTFLYQPPEADVLGRLVAPMGSMDEFSPGENAIYLFCPHGYGKTKLSNSFFERRLGMPVTTRNWTTVEAVWKMLGEG